MKTQSLSKDFLVSISVLALAMTVLGAIGAFVAFEHELAARQVSFLDEYVRERSRNIDRRFSNLTDLQNAAGHELERRARALSPAEADRLVNEYYPLHADGTRRSRPQAFDGQKQRSGELIYGIGAFLGDGNHMSVDDKATFAAAYEIVSQFGQASHSQYDNFYFFTPAKTRMVMFGPARPDRLMFYRHDAPPNLDVSHEAMSLITMPQMDPMRATRCTDLQRLVQDNHGERLATACLTPAYIDGRYAGAFGSSIDLTGFFMSAVSTSLPGAVSVVATDRGELIASPAFAQGSIARQGAITAYEKHIGLDRLTPLLKRQSADSGVVTSPDGRQLVAYARLSGPNWYFLMMCPKAAVMWSAVRSASWVLAIGLLASAVQTFLLVMLTRRTVVGPIERLAAACNAQGRDVSALNIPTIEARRDEIGVLARALRAKREKVEDVLNSLEQRVSERTAELERANAEKSRFLATMSHELRTPLNGVIAVAETLAAKQADPRDRELAELIISSGRLLELVLSDILDFSKIEDGEMLMSEQPFRVEDVAHHLCEMHRPAAEAKGLKLDCVVSEDAAGGYMGDPVRLAQVLSNLLGNAVKFTQSGEIRLAISTLDGRLKFSVTDTGVGFDDDVKARLFRRFEQADSSHRRRFGGSGLGLAISKALVELMGGQISARSTPGQGSTFDVELPLARAAMDNAETEAEDDGFSLEGCRILLAEDHPTNQKVIQLILEPFGVDLEIVENGALALERLKTATYDLVLMDMQMPELDGLGATRALRTLEAIGGAARTPVIMVTANAMDEHIRDSLNAGADRHFAKPVSAEALLNAIADTLIASAEANAAAAPAVASA